MIINTFKQQQVLVEGEVNNSTDMEIDIESVGILMSFLSKNIYSDSIGSPIRETVSNAYDATIKSDCKIPIIVKLYKENYQWLFSVEDFALGLDQQDIENVIKKYLKSTKRLDNKQLGSLGLGFKSPLAYKGKPFTFIGRKNGIERKWIMYEGEVQPKIDCLYEKETTEPNGVKILINIDNYDISNFSSKIKEQLSYFSNIYVFDEYDKFNNEAKIFENELFKWSENQDDDKMHVCLGEVYYPLDFKKLGINDIYLPIALKVGLDEGVVPTLSRESFILSPETKDLLLNKIKQVSEWFVKKYNENIQEFKNLKQAWEHINNSSKYVTICEKKFEVTSLEKYSDVKFNNIKVENIKYIPLKLFKSNLDNLYYDYNIVGDLNWNGNFREKNVSTSKYRILEYKSLLVDSNITGWFREYLKTLDYKVFVKHSIFKTQDLKYYVKLLNLKDYPKSDWRNIIQEWQRVKKEFVSETIVDGTNLHLSKDCLDWKEENKSKPKYSNYVSKKLNKQKGDITIHYVKKTFGRSGLTFEKKTHPISKLHQLKYDLLIFQEEDKEIAKEFHSELKKFSNYKCVFISKGEIKKLPNTKKFKMFAKIKQKPQELKLFSKIATALLYDKELQLYNSITYNLEDTLLENISDNLYESLKTIKEYVNKYEGDYNNNVKIILEKAYETNDFDLTYESEYQSLKRFNEKFSFLKFMKCDRYDKEGFNKEINKQLLMRRICNPDSYPEFSICISESKNVEMEESI